MTPSILFSKVNYNRAMQLLSHEKTEEMRKIGKTEKTEKSHQ